MRNFLKGNIDQGYDPIEMRRMAQLLQAQGSGGDTMLAHINPQEAQMLKRAGGSGTRNLLTGLPQFQPPNAFSMFGMSEEDFYAQQQPETGGGAPPRKKEFTTVIPEKKKKDWTQPEGTILASEAGSNPNKFTRPDGTFDMGYYNGLKIVSPPANYVQGEGGVWTYKDPGPVTDTTQTGGSPMGFQYQTTDPSKDNYVHPSWILNWEKDDHAGPMGFSPSMTMMLKGGEPGWKVPDAWKQPFVKKKYGSKGGTFLEDVWDTATGATKAVVEKGPGLITEAAGGLATGATKALGEVTAETADDVANNAITNIMSSATSAGGDINWDDLAPNFEAISKAISLNPNLAMNPKFAEFGEWMTKNVGSPNFDQNVGYWWADLHKEIQEGEANILKPPDQSESEGGPQGSDLDLSNVDLGSKAGAGPNTFTLIEDDDNGIKALDLDTTDTTATTDTTDTTTTTTTPKNVKDMTDEEYWTYLRGEADKLPDYQKYTGDIYTKKDIAGRDIKTRDILGRDIEGLSQDELAAIEQFRGLDYSTDPEAMQSAIETMQKAQGYTPDSLEVTKEGVEGVMNPYLDAAMKRVAKQQAIANQLTGRGAMSAGAFGGSRHGIREGETSGQYADTAAELAYDNYMDMYDRLQTQLLNRANLGMTGATRAYDMSKGLQDWQLGRGRLRGSDLLQTGRLQRDIEQAKADERYRLGQMTADEKYRYEQAKADEKYRYEQAGYDEDYRESGAEKRFNIGEHFRMQDDPYKKLQAQTSVAAGEPIPTTTTTGGSYDGGGGDWGFNLEDWVKKQCCFIMLEARYGDGTMDDVVRRFRDEKMTTRNKRGYYKLASVLVPLMREYKMIHWLVRKLFADPLVCYGKYYYGKNRHGWLFKGVKNFWMKALDLIGGDVEFKRENGEYV